LSTAYKHINERSLLLKASKGNELAFKELFDYYKNYIYSVSFKILKAEMYSEDVLQEVFLKVWLNRAKLSEIDNFKGYLTTIASNHIYNLLRKKTYESLYLEYIDIQTDKYVINNYYRSEASCCFNSDLQRAMDSLTPQQKRIFRLSRIEGLKHAEIASKFNISKETVKKHVIASLLVIRKQLSHYRDIENISIILLFLFVK